MINAHCVRQALLLLLVTALAAAFPSTASAETRADLQAVLDRVAAEHRLVPGITAYVDAPREGLPWKGAAGHVAIGSPRSLDPADPYRIASVMKPFTAAGILRLIEDGRMALGDRIGKYLPADIVNRISVIDGVSYGPQITIRQLLNHTSGVYSHDEDPAFTVQVGALPNKRWTAEEEIEIAIRNGPYFKPGTGWRYSDTGFVMLGLILARATGKSYAAALRELLPLRRLGLTATYHELLEAAPAGSRPLAHQYFAAYDFANHDPSFDSWGGGGYVSSSRDLARFVRALFEGRVFRRYSTLTTMLRGTPSPGAADGAVEYGLGMGRRVFDGTSCWGHPGFWSSLMYYCPSLDLAFAGTTNQALDEHGHHTEGFLGDGILKVVKSARPKPRVVNLDLHLALRFRSARLRGSGRRCARSRVRATVTGRDRDKAVRAKFFRGRRKVAFDRRPPLSQVIDRRHHRGRSHRYTARARVRLRDGGLARLKARYRVCAESRLRSNRPSHPSRDRRPFRAAGAGRGTGAFQSRGSRLAG